MRRNRYEDEDGKPELRGQRKRSEPEFESGQVISSHALVTDANGRGWWVDPADETIKPAGVIKVKKRK